MLNAMILFLSCFQPSGDRSLPSYEESISSLQLPKKLPPINLERSQAVATADTSLRGYKALGRAAAEGFSKPIVQYCTPWKSEAKVPKIGATLKFWFSAQDRTF